MGVRRAAAAILTPAALLLGPGAGEARAHAGLVRSDPAAGAALGAAPASVRLTLSERTTPSLSVVRVLDRRGVAQPVGQPAAVTDDPLALAVALGRLPRGVYTVSWRIVSAVDGHATSGVYAFGVGERPTGAGARATSTTPGGSAVEMLGRWMLLAGLVAMLGAAAAAVARFGGSEGAERRLGGAGWLLAAAGLVLLFDAQRRSAGAPVGELLRTDVGEALIWRALAIAAAGLALLTARRWRAQPRRAALAMAALAAATAAAVAVHAAAGHAGAGSWPVAISVGSQWAHIVAVGVWIGGLAALLLGIRGAASEDKAAAVRRFSLVAAGGLAVVAAAGTARAIDELTSVAELWSGAYGRAVLAKIALLTSIVALAVRGRRRAIGVAARDLAPLRRTSRAELLLATTALALAAVLGTVAPPVAGDATAAPALSATGADFATTLRVRLTAASAEPGANGFVARVTDYDSGESLRDARVRLRFEPLDDPGVDATSLALARDRDGSYAGSGSNLAFDGRWRVTALVQRAADAVEVPLELDVPSPKHGISIQRSPGRPPAYTAQVIGSGYVRIAPDPERAGPSTVAVDVFTVFQDFAAVDRLVLTAAAGNARPRPRPVRRTGRGRFAAQVDLVRGANTVAVVARTPEGTRLRAVFELDVPR